MRIRAFLAALALCCVVVLPGPSAVAHPVVVDGMSTEWFARQAPSDNLGLVARNATQQGEYIWRDQAADTRTDLATPETEADLTRVQITGTPTGLAFLFQVTNTTPATPSVQVQVAIDMDRT